MVCQLPLHPMILSRMTQQLSKRMLNTEALRSWQLWQLWRLWWVEHGACGPGVHWGDRWWSWRMATAKQHKRSFQANNKCYMCTAHVHHVLHTSPCPYPTQWQSGEPQEVLISATYDIRACTARMQHVLPKYSMYCPSHHMLVQIIPHHRKAARPQQVVIHQLLARLHVGPLSDAHLGLVV